MTKKLPRVHEWAWPKVQKRTVCGLSNEGRNGRRLAETTVIVDDLGGVEEARRCGSCERMRGAIGESARKDKP